MRTSPITNILVMNMFPIQSCLRVVIVLGLMHCFPAFPIRCRVYFEEDPLEPGFHPFPVADFRQVFAVLVDIVFVLDEFVLHLLLQICTP